MPSMYIRKISIKILLPIMLFMLAGCTQSEVTFNQAARELPFPVLLPVNLPDDWGVVETVYEDDLLVISYDTGREGRIELVQDQNIKGMEFFTLRDYMISGITSQRLLEEGKSIHEFYGYVGELISFDEPVPTIQYTFVNKQNLFGALEDVPVYQVIGKQASLEDLKKILEKLEAVPR